MAQDLVAFSSDEMTTLARQLSEQANRIDELNRAYEKSVQHVYEVWRGPAQQAHSQAYENLKQMIGDIQQTCQAFSLATTKAHDMLSAAEDQNRQYFT